MVDYDALKKVSIEAQNLHVKDQTVMLPVKLKIARIKETQKNHQKQLNYAFLCFFVLSLTFCGHSNKT